MAVGIVTLAWPSVTVLALVILFAVYAFIAAGLQAARAIVRGPVYRKPAWGDAMGEKKPAARLCGAYETVETALADLDAIEQLHKDEMIGQYDAAVIDREGGKPHVVKRTDRPRIRVIPERFGGGTLPRKELHEAAEQLTADQAGSSRWASRRSNKESTRR